MDVLFDSTPNRNSSFSASASSHKLRNTSTNNNNNNSSKQRYDNSNSNGSTLSLTSPTKLNVVSRDWNYNNNSSKLDTATALQSDRFIPSRSISSNNKLENEQILPEPNASPQTHIKSQSQIIYKQSVANACGIKVGEKILQYKIAPPISKSKFEINNNNSLFNYQRSFNNSANNSTINPIRLRKISSNPERVLDAPGFIDDFYLNLISWSSTNFLAIALDRSLYIWNAGTGSVSLLTECSTMITSIRWSEDSSYLSIGKNDGSIEIWDLETNLKLRTMNLNYGIRCASQSWNNHLILTGLKSGEILVNDVRIKNNIISNLKNHIGEVCSIEFSKNGLQFASGSNDNTVCIWDNRSSLPQFTKNNHTAAVKAISWHPEITSLLATGGGSSDKFIHFWNTTTGSRINSINTNSQISSLNWGSSNSFKNEIVATGGYPNNSISIYSFDNNIKVAEIENAHDSRIISSQLSPDGSILATIGADENLKFFKIFNQRKKESSLSSTSSLSNGKNISKVMTIR